MHLPVLSYPISRPYPYSWFTPVVIAGGAAFIVLFSFINYASSGYTLVSEYSTDPNATLHEKVWFGKWPSFLVGQVKPTCLPSSLDLGTTLYTNNTALRYTLGGIGVPDSNIISQPSLVYFNNPLQNCSVHSVQLSARQLDRTANQMGWSRWGMVLQGNVVCQVAIESTGLTWINLTAIYDYVPSTVGTSTGLYRFPGRNLTHGASLFWGESLLSMYYKQLADTLFTPKAHEADSITYNAVRNAGETYSIIDVNFWHNSSSAQSIADLGYYWVNERHITINPNQNYTEDRSNGEGLGYINGWPGVPGNDPDSPLAQDLAYLAENGITPNLWEPADNFSKVFESTIMADLGQTGGQNILSDENLLQSYTANFTGILNGFWKLDPGPARTDYEDYQKSARNNVTGPLVISPSTLATTYICQIPKRKAAADLIVSVLVANLVFIQFAWFIFTTLVQQWIERKDPEAMFCAGCKSSLVKGYVPPSESDDDES